MNLAPRVWRRRAAIGAAVPFFFLLSNPVLAQTLGQGAADDISIWRILAALALCLVLAVVGAFALKSRMAGGQLIPFALKKDRRLKLVESLRLANQVDLCIVLCDGRELLVAASAHGVDLLKHLPLADGSIPPEGLA